MIIHKSYCGKGIFSIDGSLLLNCGDDLGGFNGEFAQCSDCVQKDYDEQKKELSK